MPACGFIKASGEACKALPMRGEGWCYVHHPSYQEQRRRAGSKGGKRSGRGRPQAELADIKDRIRAMVQDVRDGTMDRADAAVCGQLYNTLIRAVSVELKIVEQRELVERLDELEAAFEHKKEGVRRGYA